jgi:hypothetical protein
MAPNTVPMICHDPSVIKGRCGHRGCNCNGSAPRQRKTERRQAKRSERNEFRNTLARNWADYMEAIA